MNMILTEQQHTTKKKEKKGKKKEKERQETKMANLVHLTALYGCLNLDFITNVNVKRRNANFC